MKRLAKNTTKSASRRRVLALLGTGLSTALAGCGSRSGEEVEYENGGTVGNLSTTEDGNGSNASEAIAAGARAEQADDSYAVELDALELRDHELVVKDDYRGVVIEGIVANTSEERVEYVEVRARIYNTGGNQLDRYLDSTNDLAAGSTWSFDIIVLENPGDVGSYDIAVLGSLG